MSEAKITTKQITMTEIEYRSDMDWAKIRLEEDTGFLSIQSDYGNWSFGWPRHGRPSLAYFLASLDSGYIGGKFGIGQVIDEHASKAAVRAYILKRRREAGSSAEIESDWMYADWKQRNETWVYGDGACPGPEPKHFCWTKDRAREEWGLVTWIGRHQGVDDWLRETSIGEAFYLVPVTETDPQWQSFWIRIWEPHIRPELRRLAQVAA